MTKREKMMLISLFCSAGLALFWYIRTELVSLSQHLEDQIAQKELLIEKVRFPLHDTTVIEDEIVALERSLENMQNGFYNPSIMTSYEFGLYVRDLIRSENLEISRYQILEDGSKDQIEFHLKGDSLDFFSFLYNYSFAPGMHEMNYLSLRREKGNILNITMRTSYASMDE